MSVQPPDLGWWGWVWNAVTYVAAGSAWPDVDEDTVRQLGQRYQALAEHLQASGAELAPLVAAMDAEWRGARAEELQRHWRYSVGSAFPGLASGASDVSAWLDNAARAVEKEKLEIIISVIACCIELMIILIAAWFSGGLSSLAASGPIAATRSVIAAAYRLLLAEVQRGLARQFVVEAVREGLQEFAIDLTAQGIQLGKGTRQGLDVSSLAWSAGLGAAGGVAGQALAPGLGRLNGLALSVPNDIARWTAKTLAEGLHDKATNEIVNYLGEGLRNGNWTPHSLGWGDLADVAAGGVRERVSDASHAAIDDFVKDIDALLPAIALPPTTGSLATADISTTEQPLTSPPVTTAPVTPSVGATGPTEGRSGAQPTTTGASRTGDPMSSDVRSGPSSVESNTTVASGAAGLDAGADGAGVTTSGYAEIPPRDVQLSSLPPGAEAVAPGPERTPVASTVDVSVGGIRAGLLGLDGSAGTGTPGTPSIGPISGGPGTVPAGPPAGTSGPTGPGPTGPGTTGPGTPTPSTPTPAGAGTPTPSTPTPAGAGASTPTSGTPTPGTPGPGTPGAGASTPTPTPTGAGAGTPTPAPAGAGGSGSGGPPGPPVPAPAPDPQPPQRQPEPTVVAPPVLSNTVAQLATIDRALREAAPTIDGYLTRRAPATVPAASSTIEVRGGEVRYLRPRIIGARSLDPPARVAVRVEESLPAGTARVEVPTDHLARSAGGPEARAILVVAADLVLPANSGRLADRVVGAIAHARESYQRHAEAGGASATRATAADLGRRATLDSALLRDDADAMVDYLKEFQLLPGGPSLTGSPPVLRGWLSTAAEHRMLAKLWFGTRAVSDEITAIGALNAALRDAAVESNQPERPTIAAASLAPDVVTVLIDGEPTTIPLRVVDPGDRTFAVRLVEDAQGPRIELRRDASDVALAVDAAGVIAELVARHETTSDVVAAGQDARLTALRSLRAAFGREGRIALAHMVEVLGVGDAPIRALDEKAFRRLDRGARRTFFEWHAGRNLQDRLPFWRRGVSFVGSTANTIGVGQFNTVEVRGWPAIFTSVGASLGGSVAGQGGADYLLGPTKPKVVLRTAKELPPSAPVAPLDPRVHTPFRENLVKRVPLAVLTSTGTLGIGRALGLDPTTAAAGGIIAFSASILQAAADRLADPHEKTAGKRREQMEAVEPDRIVFEASQSLLAHARTLAMDLLRDPTGANAQALRQELQEIRDLVADLERRLRPITTDKIAEMQSHRHRLATPFAKAWNRTAGRIPGVHVFRERTGPAGNETYGLHILPEVNAGPFVNEFRVGIQQALMQIASFIVSKRSPELAAANVVNAAARGLLYGNRWTQLSIHTADAKTALQSWDAQFNLRRVAELIDKALDPAHTLPSWASIEPPSSVREQIRRDRAEKLGDETRRPRTGSPVFETAKHVGGGLAGTAAATAYLSYIANWPDLGVAVYTAGNVIYAVFYIAGENVMRLRPDYAIRAAAAQQLFAQASALPLTPEQRLAEMKALAELTSDELGDITKMALPPATPAKDRWRARAQAWRRGSQLVRSAVHLQRGVLRAGSDRVGPLINHEDHTKVDELHELLSQVKRARQAGRTPRALDLPAIYGGLHERMQRYGLLPDQRHGDERWEAVRATMLSRHGMDPEQVPLVAELRTPSSQWSTELAEAAAVLDGQRSRDPLPPLLAASLEELSSPGRTVELLAPGRLRVETEHGVSHVEVQAGDLDDPRLVEIRPAADSVARALTGQATGDPHVVVVNKELLRDGAALSDPAKLADVLREAILELDGTRSQRFQRLGGSDRRSLMVADTELPNLTTPGVYYLVAGDPAPELHPGALPPDGDPLYRFVPRLLPNGEVNPAYTYGLQGLGVPPGVEDSDTARRAETTWYRSRDDATPAHPDGLLMEWRTGHAPPGATWEVSIEVRDSDTGRHEVRIKGVVPGVRVLRVQG